MVLSEKSSDYISYNVAACDTPTTPITPPSRTMFIPTIEYDINDELSPIGASDFVKLVEKAQPL